MKTSRKQPEKIVISASRRTDIPAFYMDWFIRRIKKGFFKVENPYNRQVRIVPATSDMVHTIVFWSKNYGYFLKRGFAKDLQKRGFNLFFNFTINSSSQILEPNVGKLKERIEQLKEMTSRFGAESIFWRFDPISFYYWKNENIKNNLADFSYIAEKAAKYGIKRCITSFADIYPKVEKRAKKIAGFSFADVTPPKKTEILLRMEKRLSSGNISLFLCCEKEILESLPQESKIGKSSCIPSDFLIKIFGGNLSMKKDAGQRASQGCGCMISADIGSYAEHPCFHNCLFCYANPVCKK